MISYPVYKIVHYLGIFTLVTALGAFIAQHAAEGAAVRASWARPLVIAHGVGLFLVLLGGFGMLARLDVTEGLSLPTWIWIKLGLWGLIGLGVTATRRRPQWSGVLLMAVPLLAVVAGAVALTKPGG